MGGLLLVMDSYGHGDNFQPVFNKITVKFHTKKERRKSDEF